MLNVLFRRLIQAVLTVFVVVTLVFVLFSVIPGSYASSLQADKRDVSAEVLAQIEAELGLNDPLPLRFGRYVGNLVQGDLGTSYATKRPVADMLSGRIWASLRLACAAIAFAICIGLPLGFFAAMRRGSWLDTATMTLAVSGLSVPGFWAGLLLMYLFSLTLRWLPTFGYGTGGFVNLILPAITLGIAPMALLARTTRAAVLETMNSEFIRTARSKGMSEGRLVRRHLARNAFVLILTTIGLQFGSMLGGSVVVEKLFAWPGVGSLLIDSVGLRDIPTVQGTILVIVLFFLLINTLVDLAYLIVDPRIRYR